MPVMAVKEVGLGPSELQALQKFMEANDYRFYCAKPIMRLEQACGGVLILVSNRYRCQQVIDFSEQEAQAVTILLDL